MKEGVGLACSSGPEVLRALLQPRVERTDPVAEVQAERIWRLSGTSGAGLIFCTKTCIRDPEWTTQNALPPKGVAGS